MTTVRKDIGLPFTLLPYKSYSDRCPVCADSRSKQATKSLSIYRDTDGKIRYVCHHPGCSWNQWQCVDDPNPQDLEQLDTVKQKTLPVPAHIVPPLEYNGDMLYWYRDRSGTYLFANRRINLPSGKVYVPFVYTSTGFSTGKGTKWPENFKGLYGAHTIPGKTKAVVVEGEKAAEAAMKIFPNHAVVSWLGGANRGALDADWSELAGFETVLLWPDNDEAGKSVMQKLASKIPAGSVLIADVSKLPAKADLADTLTDDQIREAIKGATKFEDKIPGVFTLADIKKQISNAGLPRKSGYDVFDFHTKLPSSGLVVIEGRTKHGKSALAVALTSQMLRLGLESKVLFYSFEMTAAKVFNRYLKSVDPKLTLENFEEFDISKEITDLISSGKLKIVDQSTQPSMAEMVVSVSRPQMRGAVVIIDYLQIVPIQSSYKSSRQLMIKEMLDEIRVAAHKNNVLVLVLSQLTPDYSDPRNDSPREAKDIHYSADTVLRIWNKKVGETHPTYNNLGGDYLIHTYLNRDGESNVLFEGSLEEGSKLSIRRRARTT